MNGEARVIKMHHVWTIGSINTKGAVIIALKLQLHGRTLAIPANYLYLFIRSVRVWLQQIICTTLLLDGIQSDHLCMLLVFL